MATEFTETIEVIKLPDYLTKSHSNNRFYFNEI